MIIPTKIQVGKDGIVDVEAVVLKGVFHNLSVIGAPAVIGRLVNWNF